MLGRLKRLRTRNLSLVPPTDTLSRAYRTWVSQALAAAQREAPPPQAPEGFVLEVLPGGGRLWLLAEAPEGRRGGGALVLRVGAARPLSLQAPHTYFDAGTLPIAVDQFERLGARALLINTVHRAAGVPKADKERVIRMGRAPSDVAHLSNSLFAEAHAALAAAASGPGGLLAVQLHGYSDARVPGVHAVVSGARSRLARVGELADGLSVALAGAVVAAFPRDTRDLGGTENRQAHHSRSVGQPFLHIELSSSLRRRLGREPELAAGLASWIARAGEWSLAP